MEACPKCNFALAPEAAECPACGVILAKLRAASGLQRQVHQPVPPPLATPANPYAPPVAPVEGQSVQPPPAPVASPAENLITWLTLDALTTMRPWLRFLAVCGLLFNTLTLLAALGLLFWSGEKTELLPIALIYLVSSGVGFAIIAPLNRSATALAGLTSQSASGSLESFVSEQMAFWRRLGVLCIVYLVLVAGLVVFGALAGALAK